jgi:hypothetical protein
MEHVSPSVEEQRVGNDSAGDPWRPLEEKTKHLLDRAGAVEKKAKDSELIEALGLLSCLFETGWLSAPAFWLGRVSEGIGINTLRPAAFARPPG